MSSASGSDNKNKKKVDSASISSSKKSNSTGASTSKKSNSTGASSSKNEKNDLTTSKPEKIKYEDMPKSHKRKLYTHGTSENYSAIINWLRTMCCSDGSVFKGIPSLKYSRGYPLVQIKVVTNKKESAKFIICRKDLYLIAFMITALKKGKAEKVGFQFNQCGYDIGQFKTMTSYNGNYRGQPWRDIGPCHMKDAVHKLNESSSSQEDKVNACEVFFVHLSEAARFRPFEFMVCRSLASAIVSGEMGSFDERMLEGDDADEEDTSFEGEGIPIIEKDFYSLMKSGELTPEECTDYLGELVKNHSNLSQIWYAYSLSDRKVFKMKADQREKLYMKCVKSMRSTLAVLCHLNVGKLKEDLGRKVAEGVITNQEFKKIEEKLKSLRG